MTLSFAHHDRADSAWNRAVDVGAQGDAFCCRTEWQLSFHETFPLMAERTLHVRTAGGSAVAFAERADSQWGCMLEPVEISWLFGSPLLGDDAVALLVDLLAENGGALGRANVLISGLLSGSDVRRQLAQQLHGRFEFFGFDPQILVSASLDGGLDGYLAAANGAHAPQPGSATAPCRRAARDVRTPCPARRRRCRSRLCAHSGCRGA